MSGGGCGGWGISLSDTMKQHKLNSSNLLEDLTIVMVEWLKKKGKLGNVSDIGHQFTTAANFLDPSVTALHKLLPLKGEKTIQISSVLDRVLNLQFFSRASCDSIWLEKPSFEKWVVIHHQAGIAHGFIYSR